MTDEEALIEALCNPLPLLVTDQRFELTQKAADEIERLQAALRKIRDVLEKIDAGS